MFMVPTRGPNKGIAFRFANAPVEAELTGPYFSPNEDTLFVNVQHPGELTGPSATGVFGQEATYTSWWPEGNKTALDNPATPRPSTVAISRAGRHDEEASRFIPPPPE
jgi:secreted PhoX family phosphatase